MSTVPPSLSERLNTYLLSKATPQNIESLRESCIFTTLMSGVMGGGFGAMFGLFMASIGPSSMAEATTPTRLQLRLIFVDMLKRSFSSGKSFATIAALFSGTECMIESYRAKHDWKNGLGAGCMTGGLMAVRSGPKAIMVGCAGFAAFTTAVERIMAHNSQAADL